MTTTRRSLLAMTGAGLTLAAIGPVVADFVEKVVDDLWEQ
jgi:hypothetical protein